MAGLGAATVIGSLAVKMVLDSDEYHRDLSGAAEKANAFGQKLTSAGGKLTAGLTLPLVALGVSAVGMASDVAESMSKVDVVFGGSAQIVKDFAASAATDLGMTEGAALSAMGTYGNLFTAMGLGDAAAADMSMGLTQLASDLASFNNMDPTVVLDKLRAGLTGETEPMKALGVNINAAAVEAQALTMGLGTTTVSITKVAAAQEKLAKAQEKVNNLTKGHAADSTEAQGALLKYQGLMLDIEQASTRAAAAVGKYGEGSIQALQAQQTVSEKTLASKKAWEEYEIVLKGVGLESEEGRKATEALEKAQANLTAVMEGGTTTLTAAEKAQATYALIMEQTSNAQGDFARTSDGLANSTRIAKAQLADIGAEMGAVLLPIGIKVVSFVRDLLTWFTALSPNIKTAIVVVAGLAAAIGPVVSIVGGLITAFSTIMPIIGAVAGLLTFPLIAIVLAVGATIALVATAWKNNWGGIQEKVAAVLEWMKPFIQDALAIIRKVFDAFSLAFKGDWEGFGRTLREGWDMAWKMIKNIVTSGLNAIKAIDWGALGRSIIQGIAMGIANAADWIVAAVKKVAGAAIAAIKAFLGISSPSKVGLALGINFGGSFGAGIGAMGDYVAAAAGQIAMRAHSAIGGVTTYYNTPTLNVYTNAPAEQLASDFGLLYSLTGV